MLKEISNKSQSQIDKWQFYDLLHANNMEMKCLKKLWMNEFCATTFSRYFFALYV